MKKIEKQKQNLLLIGDVLHAPRVGVDISTIEAFARMPGRSSGVSICAFVLVKQVN
jgi:hypothetical protein